MSLIQDALKRKTEEQNVPDAPQSEQPVQSAKPLKKTVPPPAPPTPAPEVPAADSSGINLFIMLAVIMTLVLLLIGAGIFIASSRSVVPLDVVETETAAQPEPPVPAPSVPAPSVTPTVATPAPPPVAAPEPINATQDWPDLSYSGSAIGGNQILAVINGRMLSVGSRIKGVKVLQIGKSEVLVEFQGEKRILNIDDE